MPGQYPLPRCGHALLNNQGNGQFTAVTDPAFAGLGMVTGALWSDADGDGWLDLLLTYDWGPVRCLGFRQGKWEDRTEAAGLATLLGWWNGIVGGDLDRDGDMDYVVSNFGLNTKYATPEHPELIYYGDFEGNGRYSIVEAKLEGNTLLPRRGFSCSQQAMPFVRDKMKTFHGFASASLPEIYSEDALKNALKLQANHLESGVLRNDGQGGSLLSPCLDWRRSVRGSAWR